uniref:DUF4817 domain-containing protein n=1 Tax=Acrobeloides nanus TaxID=290746 RepID=A0A914BYD7_9BILA
MRLSAFRLLTVLERAKLVCWYEETQCYTMTARRFRAEFGHDPPPLSEIKDIHKRFLETGSTAGEPIREFQKVDQTVVKDPEELGSATLEQFGLDPPPLTRRHPPV